MSSSPRGYLGSTTASRRRKSAIGIQAADQLLSILSPDARGEGQPDPGKCVRLRQFLADPGRATCPSCVCSRCPRQRPTHFPSHAQSDSRPAHTDDPRVRHRQRCLRPRKFSDVATKARLSRPPVPNTQFALSKSASALGQISSLGGGRTPSVQGRGGAALALAQARCPIRHPS